MPLLRPPQDMESIGRTPMTRDHYRNAVDTGYNTKTISLRDLRLHTNNITALYWSWHILPYAAHHR